LAIAASELIGRGNEKAAGHVAVEAMQAPQERHYDHRERRDARQLGTVRWIKGEHRLK
jgi:hypothetical protein